MSSSLIGRKLGGYDVTELLGQGGMATVYKGYQASVDRAVAIKVLPPHPGLDSQFITRFEIEAKTIARLQHPHILPLYDYGQEDNILYLVMAYIGGGSLDGIVADGPMPVKQVQHILRQVAAALDYAHRQGVIHRDIKPGNILLDNDGNALLADFGIVKMTDSGVNITGTGVVGTPAYMSPEQAQGLQLDNRSDIYALGCVVYEMLTGRQPYAGDTPMQVLLKHIGDPVPDISRDMPHLPPTITLVMQKALAKHPDDRFQTAVEFADAFARAATVDASVMKAPIQPTTSHRAESVPTVMLPTEKLPGAHNIQPEQQPTIIMQSPGGLNNPLVLLGAFGLIALVIVVVAIVLVNNSASPAGEVGQNPTAAINNTPDSSAAAAPTIIPVDTTPPPARITYITSTAPGDTANVQFTELPPPADGTQYVVWLQNTETGDTLLLGTATLDALGSGQLTYMDDESLLPARYNAAIITEESVIGDVPAGTIVYQGSVPAVIMTSITAILLGDETGINGASLLESANTEAFTGNDHAGRAAAATNLSGVMTHTEHTINILRGDPADFNGNGRAENPGRGFGVYVFMDAIEMHLNAIFDAPDSAQFVRNNAQDVLTCVENVRHWADDTIVQAQTVFTTISDAGDDADTDALLASIQPLTDRMVNLSANLLNGIDANENRRIDPFEDECGLAQIDDFTLLIGNIDLREVTDSD